MKAIVIAKSKKENTAKLCLILNYRIPIGEYVLEFPAGQKEAEESNETCAIREVKEETGYTGKLIPASVTENVVLCDPWKSNDNTQYLMIEIDLDDECNLNPVQELDPSELTSVIFLDLYNLQEEIQNLIKEKEIELDSGLWAFAAGIQMGKELQMEKYNQMKK